MSMSAPLTGRRLLVPTSRLGPNLLARRLEALGAETVAFPRVVAMPPNDRTAFDRAMLRLSDYDRVVAVGRISAEALIRRASGHHSPILTCCNIVLDTNSARVTMDGNPVDLTALEYRTLEYLMQHPEKVISKTELTEHIYDQDFDRDSNVIEVLINRLRGKLRPDLINTRRGLGYQIGKSDGSS